MDLVLFDLDHTLLDGDSDHLWTSYLIERGILDSATQTARNERFYQQYREGTLDIHEFLRFQLAPLTAHPRAELDAWHADYMTRHIVPRIGARARGCVNEHLERGALVALVTATNSFVTAPIAREFGIQHLIACVAAQHANGEYTGSVRGTPSFQEGKINRVEEWLEGMALHLGSFEKTWFYSDSHNDLPLLERVSHPIAATPDETLARIANERGWPVVSLRDSITID